ncbi:unnamed protein product [Symbiodinium sp. CCMP2592]|nr:unnamed protein product [Symbiodinium sp. CCMP2592]
MGKTWKQRGGYDRNQDGWDGSGYGHVPYLPKEKLWRGAYSPRAPWKRGEDARPPAFPSYTQLAPKESTTHTAAAAPTFVPDATLSELQKTLTAARKAENRVRSLLSQKEKNEQQWEAYKDTMEKTFIQEHKRFVAGAAKIQRDLDAAVAHQDEARQDVRAAYNGEPVKPSRAAEQEKAALSAWDAMRDMWERSQDVDMEGVLHRAVNGQPSTTTAPEAAPLRKLKPEFLQQLLADPGVQAAFWAAAPQGGPGHADGSHMGAPTFDVPTFGGSATAGHGLMTSQPPGITTVEDPDDPRHGQPDPAPSTGKAEAMAGVHPGQRDLGASRVPSHEGPPRPDVKTATRTTPQRPTVHKGLGEKLEEKRQQARQGVAMHPFGLPGHASGGPIHVEPHMETNVDDNDEELDRVDGHRSPGLGKLEVPADLTFGCWCGFGLGGQDPVETSMGKSRCACDPLDQRYHTDRQCDSFAEYPLFHLAVYRLQVGCCVSLGLDSFWPTCMPLFLADVILGCLGCSLGSGVSLGKPSPGSEVCMPPCSPANNQGIYAAPSWTSRALKKHIGSSGVFADFEVQRPGSIDLVPSRVISPPTWLEDPLLVILLHITSFLIPLARAVLFILFLAVFRLLCGALPSRREPLGRLLMLPSVGGSEGTFQGVPGHFTVLTNASLSKPIPPEDGKVGVGLYGGFSLDVSLRAASRQDLGPSNAACPFVPALQDLPVTGGFDPLPDDLPLSNTIQSVSGIGNYDEGTGLYCRSEMSLTVHLAGRFANDLGHALHPGDATAAHHNGLDPATPGYAAPAPRPDTGHEEEGGESELGLQIGQFIVIVPDSLPEQIAIVLDETTTSRDVLAVAAREVDEQRLAHFPLLLPIVPQPDSHWGTLLSLPSWAHDEPIACIDTRELDGRLFATDVPRHATKEQLCRRAGFEATEPIGVFAYGSTTPLGPDDIATFVPGGLIVISDRPDQRAQLPSLEQLLLLQHSWDADPEIPYGPAGRHHCCVTGGQRLITHNPQLHPELHSSIAAALQLNLEHTDILPATPPVTDAAINGHHCLSVQAIVSHFAGDKDPDLIVGLLDCRPLLQGWSLIAAPGGRTSYLDLVTVLDTFAPQGWTSRINTGDLDEAGNFQVAPGQVFTASYVSTAIPEDVSDNASGEDVGADGPPEDGESAEALMPQLRNLPFFVAALAVVRNARSAQDRRNFPVLTAARPQPINGAGLFLADAAWDNPYPTLCLDTTVFDGRLFAVVGRFYADKHSLLILADLPLGLNVDIYVGTSPDPIAEGQEQQMTHGDVIKYQPAGTRLPHRYSLGFCLQHPGLWDACSFSGLVAPPDVYGLVHDSQCILHLPGPSTPMNFRRHIAATIGTDEARLRLFPSVPRVSNAEISGHPVRNIVGVSELAGEFTRTSCCVLLDARPLGQQWHEIHVHGDHFEPLALSADFDRHAPAGWRTRIQDANGEEVGGRIVPGQVLEAVYVPTGFGRERSIAEPISNALDDDPAAAPGIPPVAPPATASALGTAAAQDQRDAIAPDHPGVLPRPTDDPTSSHTDGPAFANCIFLILGQNYCPEVVQVRLRVGCPETEALETVNAARSPVFRGYLPRICSVYPQTIQGIAVLVAVPLWPVTGAIVVLDTMRINGQICAQQLPSIITREGACIAARVSLHAPHELYVHDMPWPAQPGMQLGVSHGDALLIVPSDTRHFVLSDLTTMLHDPDCWNTDWTPDVPFAERSWIISESRDFLFPILPGRRDQVSRDVASLLGLPTASFRLFAPDPSIITYADNGVPVQHVLAAVQLETRAGVQRARPPACFVDCRPLLQTVRVLFDAEACLDTQRLAHLFWRCPAGYVLCYLSSSGLFQPLGDTLTFADRSVIVLAYVPAVLVHTGDTLESEAQHNDGTDQDSPEHDRSSGTQESHPGDRAPSSHSRSTGHDAGTGGSRHAQGRPLPPQTGLSVCACGSLCIIICIGGLSEAGVFIGILFAAIQGAWVLRFGFAVCLLPAVTAMQFQRTELHAPDVHRADYDSRCISIPDILRIPTPCRNSKQACPLTGPAGNSEPLGEPTNCPHDQELRSIIDSWPVDTLLNQSMRSNPEPFFLAATLLDTLCEHFAGSSDGVHPCRLLRLADHLPPCPQFDLTATTMNVSCTLDQLQAFLQTRWQLHSNLPSALHLHPATESALADHCHIARDAVLAVEIYTDGSFHSDLSTWAFVVRVTDGYHWSVFGWARGTVALAGSVASVGALQHSAIEGERSALFWATAWAICSGFTCPISFWGDNSAALGQTRGTCGSADSSASAAACRAVSQAAEAIRGAPLLAYGHVKAHQGQAFNELADTLAKAHHLGDTPIPDAVRQVAGWARAGSLDWLWLLIESTARPDLWPRHQGPILLDPIGKSMPIPNPRREFLSLQPEPVPAEAAALTDAHLALRLVTINVQTLEEDGHKNLPGRTPYIRAQLHEQGATFIGLQETRSKRTETIVSQTHLRYTSAADASGNLGVELWISRHHPFAWQGQVPARASPSDFRVVGWSPRHLFVRCQRDTIRFLLTVCHAPTTADAHRNSWWKGFSDALISASRGDPVIILGDLNTRFTDPIPGHVGELCWEKEQDIPEQLMRLLKTLNLWIPATYQCCHDGPSYTWAAPGSGSKSRLDYVIIPGEWQAAPGSSRTLLDVDFGQTGVDHFAAQLDVSVTLTRQTRKPVKGRRIDVRKMRDPLSRDIVRTICRTTPDVPWNVDVHTHCDLVTRHLVDSLALAFPLCGAVCRRAYFTATTWAFRQQRTACRKILHRGIAALSLGETGAAFWAWRTPANSTSIWRLTVAGSLKWIHGTSQSIRQFKALKPMLRRSIRTDRASYLRETAQQAATSPAKSVYEKLRPLLGPPKHRRRGLQELPAIALENGEIAQTRAETEARWIRHFSAVEAGHPEDPLDIVGKCLARQHGEAPVELSLEAEDVPTRTHIESSIRKTPCGKAAGKDNVPPDLLHHFASDLSLPVYRLALKAFFRQTEPLQWKGGELFHVWKRKGSALDCSSYRAILVSSTLGKAVHGAFREKTGPVFDRAAAPLQLGGRRGCPVQLVVQAARLFQQACTARRQSSALIFVDLKEAFHRVARPLVHGGEVGSEHLAAVVTALGLSEDVVPQLQHYAQSASRFRTAGASEWSSAMLAEFGRDTWFCHGQGEGTATVTSGTRPGDNLADVLFSMLFASILTNLRTAFREAGLSVSIPWSDDLLCAAPGTPLPDQEGETARPIDVTWMDDLALLVTSDTAEDLPRRAILVATATITECIKATLLPNLAAGKTEAVLCLYGKNSRRTAATVFQGGEPSLQLESQVWPQARLRLVSLYRHVGGLIQAGGGHTKELRSRIGAAWQNFRTHKRLVFGSPVVSEWEKAVLFESLVISTLTYGIGAWPQCDQNTIDRLHNVLVHMARMMLRPRFRFEQALHLSAGYALALARILPARDTVHLERLRQLRAAVSQATPELWALLHWEGSWLRDAQASLDWLNERLHHAGQEQELVRSWQNAIQTSRDRPGLWKRSLRRAKLTAAMEAKWNAEKQQFYGYLFRQLRAAGAYVTDIAEVTPPSEVCGPCGRLFRDLRCWAHHAFKAHGRLREERTLVNGKQCPACLRHFRNNEKLCNHVRYSRGCKQQLLGAGFQAQPAPGIGSKKYDDGHRSQLPVVRAEGPMPILPVAPIAFEADRPSETVLLRLEDCFTHGLSSEHSFAALLDFYRQAFSAECLQSTRLKATALEWQNRLEAELDGDSDHPIEWGAWHTRITRSLLHIDWADWLVPDGDRVDHVARVYRDAEVLLPWITLDVALPSLGGTGDTLLQSSQLLIYFPPTASQHLAPLDFWVSCSPPLRYQ